MLKPALKHYYENSPWKNAVFCWYPYEEGIKYITLFDPSDLSVEALTRHREALGAHGRLLVAYENPFALRYWAGKRAPNTGRSYDTLFQRGDNPLPSRAVMRQRLRSAGFGGQKWYYPLSDHYFTCEIYSDDYCPDEAVYHRLVPYIEEDAALMFDERLLYTELIRGGAFTFMCGAYVVEARVSDSDAPCPVDYAAVTAYRPKDRRYATTVRSDGTVCKTPLHPHAQAGMLQTWRNHQDLAQAGVAVVPMEIINNSLVMRRLSLPTLYDYWANKLAEDSLDERAMFAQFDRIRDAIYRAYAATGKCFWEMVPANCFYDAVQDRLLFFDQEFYWEGVTPDAAVMRAIRALVYSPVLRKAPSADAWLSALEARYNLTANREALIKLTETTVREVFGYEMQSLTEETARAVRRISDRAFAPIVSFLYRRRYRRPALYGYGNYGKIIERILSCAGIAVAAIMDKRLQTDKTVGEILSEQDCDVLIVSIKDADAIAAALRAQTSIPVYTAGVLMDVEADGIASG